MDIEYIQLCAEMAYNEVIIESVLNEDILQEAFNPAAIKNRIKALVQGFINFCKNILNKIKKFISDKLKLINQKLKQKKNDNSKNDSDKTEEKTNDQINWKYVYSYMEFNYNIGQIIDDFGNKAVDIIHKLTESYDRETIEEISNNFEKLINDDSLIFNNHKNVLQNKFNKVCENSKKATVEDDDFDPWHELDIEILEDSIKKLESSIKLAGRSFEQYVDHLNNIQRNHVDDPFKSEEENSKKIKELEETIAYKEKVFKTIISESMKKVNEASSYYAYCVSLLDKIVSNMK